MIGKIVLGICMVGLVVAFFYGIYMAIWGVWNNEWCLVKQNSMVGLTDSKFNHMVLYNKINNVFNIRRQDV